MHSIGGIQQTDVFDRKESFDSWFRRSVCLIGHNTVQVSYLAPLALNSFKIAYSLNPKAFITLIQIQSLVYVVHSVSQIAVSIFILVISYIKKRDYSIDNLNQTNVSPRLAIMITVVAYAVLGHHLLAATTVALTLANWQFWQSYARSPRRLLDRFLSKVVLLKKLMLLSVTRS